MTADHRSSPDAEDFAWFEQTGYLPTHRGPTPPETDDTKTET